MSSRTMLGKVALGGSICFALACSDNTAVPTAPGNARSLGTAGGGEVSVAPDAVGNRVARALALALKDTKVRAAVRDAMRASPWVEHKLVLQDFVTTPAGQELLRAAARASGEPTSALASAVSSLPLLDFYVPLRADRLSWRGTDNVTVAVALGRDLSTVTAYDVQGRTRQHTGRNRAPSKVSSGPVLILLHRAETKGERINPQAAAPGEVIQDANDGEIAVYSVPENSLFDALALHGVRRDVT